MEDEQMENLRLKEEICTILESHIAAKTATHDILKEMQDKFNNIGFVPRKDINAIRTRYHEAVDRFINSIPGISENEKGKISLENQLNDLRNDPMADRKIYQKEQVIRKKISKIENDIGLWQNNLEFFSRSQNAEKVREEFNDKIKAAHEHLKQLKDQLKLLKTVWPACFSQLFKELFAIERSCFIFAPRLSLLGLDTRKCLLSSAGRATDL